MPHRSASPALTVRDDLPDDQAQPVADRITIRFKRGVADGHFVVIQRARGEREWITLLLRVEQDGTMSLPIEAGAAVRRDATLREALNAVRPVLPGEECRLFDYQAAAGPPARITARAGRKSRPAPEQPVIARCEATKQSPA